MHKHQITIHNVPAMLFGEQSDKVYIYVHGQCACKEEAKDFAEIVCNKGFQVLSFDLPEHGARKGSAEKLVPWETVPELQKVLFYAKRKWHSISLYANSIGAYFSLLAFSDDIFEQCLFVSPVLNMVALIEKMMGWAAVTPNQLQAEKEIPTSFGETLSWEYYTYAKQHPIEKWSSPTAILYAGQDHLIDRDTVTAFADTFGCRLKIFDDGEHWFHTEEQLAVLRNWIQKQILENESGKLEISCATPQDIPAWLALVDLVSDAFPGLDMADYTETLQKNIARKTALCAKCDGTLSGILLFSPNLRMLFFMAVHPEYRRRGIASALIAEMLRRMPDGDVCVTTFRENDPMGIAPRAVYQKLGFVPKELLVEFDYPVQRFVLYRSFKD